MSVTTAPVPVPLMSHQAGYEYLLLGDLREALEEPASVQRDRWLLTLVDAVLSVRPRSGHASHKPQFNRLGTLIDPAECLLQERTGLYAKLQRLRDRLAHCAPYALLANDVRYDLQDLMET